MKKEVGKEMKAGLGLNKLKDMKKPAPKSATGTAKKCK